MAASFGGGGTPQSYMGTFPAFLAAWGPVDMGFGSGQGVKCYHSEHLYGEFWHRAFIVAPDTPLCNYLISCGANVEASGGVVGVWRHANARVRGMKRVQVEPHLSVTGACSAEWVPIKPKTDAAFLFALIHVLLHEVPRERLDLPFLRAAHRVALPGRAARLLPARPRDAASRWCGTARAARARAVRHARACDEALEGRFEVDAVEIGPDGDVLADGRLRGQHRLRRSWSSTCSRTRPNGRQAICDVPAATHAPHRQRISRPRLRRRRRSRSTARRCRYRPVAVTLGKTVNNGWGGFECCWARTLLAALVGALEVPGGTLGTTVRLNRPHVATGCESVKPGPDGFMALPAEPDRQGALVAAARTSATPTARWCRWPADGPWSQALGPTHFSWMFLDETPKGLPRVTLPDVWFVYRTNPAISFWDTAGARRAAWRASRSSSPSPTRATRPTTSPTCCCPTRPTSRACS